MRLFIAIDPPPEMLDYVVEVQHIFMEKQIFKGTYPKVENVHVTLLFLGDVPENKIPLFIQDLKEQPLKPMIFQLGNLTVDNEIHPRTLWFDIQSPDLNELFQNLAILSPDIAAVKQRPMRAHLTVARIRKFLKSHQELDDAIMNMPIKEIAFNVADIKLKKSELTSLGPIHTDIFVRHLGVH